MTGYKVADADGYTRRGIDGETRWTVGDTVRPQGVGIEPCGPGVVHLYASPTEALLYDPVHGGYTKHAGARCFSVHAVMTGDDGLKQWTTRDVRVIEEVPFPSIALDERIAWAICVDPDPSIRDWAIAWLDGTDRSTDAAISAADAAYWDGCFAPNAAYWTSIGAEYKAATAVANSAYWAQAHAVYLETKATAALGDGYWQTAFRARSLAALARGRAILAGLLPAEEYDT